MHRREAGTTLIELMVSISVMLLILVPLTGAIFLILLNDASTQTRLETANDKQLTGGYFATDVQSSDAVYVNTGATDHIAPAMPPECRVSSPGGVTNLLLLKWSYTDPTIDSATGLP